MIDRERLAALAAEEPASQRRGHAFLNRFATPHHGLGAFLRWQWESRGRFPGHQAFPLHTPDPAQLRRH